MRVNHSAAAASDMIFFLCEAFTAKSKDISTTQNKIWSCGLIRPIPNYKSMKCFAISHWDDACAYACVPSDPTTNVPCESCISNLVCALSQKSLNRAMSSKPQNIIPHMQFIRIQLNILQSATNPVPPFYVGRNMPELSGEGCSNSSYANPFFFFTDWTKFKISWL